MSGWAKEWQVLRRLVNRKYSDHIATIGLELQQFQELDGTRVNLIVRHTSFLLGAGESKKTAIREAIRTLKKDKEIGKSLNVFKKGKCLFLDEAGTSEKLKEELAIIELCLFKNQKPAK